MATNMKSLNGYGFDAAALGGKAPEYYIQPRNLLDNSDFRNPVNQRGATSYRGAGYTIDRWETNSAACKLTVEDGYIHMQNNSDSTSTATQFIRQKIENPSALIGKTITIAARVKGNCRLGCEGIGLTYPSYVNCADWTTITLTVDISAMTGSHIAAILQGANKSEWYCSWIALYEGTYTADTLPPYVPKGYAQELAECLRYFERLGSTYSERIGNTVYVVSGAKSFVCSFQCSRKRIQHPSVSISGVDNYRLLLKDATNANTYSATSISSFDDITIQEPFISFRVNMVNAITQNSWIQLQRSDGATAAYIDVSADL